MTTLKIENVDINDPRVAFVEAKVAGWAGDILVKDLYKALETFNIPVNVWPSRPSDNKCLERALNSLRGRRSLVRPLSKGRGFSLIVETADDLDLEKLGNDGKDAHQVELTCKVERGEFDTAISSIRVTPSDHPAVPLIKQEFTRYRGDTEDNGLFKCSQDLSVWFSQVIVPWCHGVATRARGGSYYIVKGKYLDRMQRVNNALQEVSTSNSYCVPIMNGQTRIELQRIVKGGRVILKPEVATTVAVEIFVDNIINEADKVTDKLTDELTTKSMGIRALKSRKEDAQKALEKLAEYENVLNMNLDDVRDRLEFVKKHIGMAELSLLNDENGSYHE